MKQLITILLCLFTLFVQAQNTNDTTKYFKSYDYGFSYKRLQAREAFIMPTDTVINKLGAVALNGVIYLGNGVKWTSIGGGTTIDTTSLSNRINQRIDSLIRRSDSVFARKNGVFVFQYKDSVGSNGSVTSVAALSLGTSGSDLNSTVANGTTTPVISLNVPDASTSARGVVTSASQTFGGTKTFRDNIYVQKTSSTSQNITIGFGGGVADYDNLAFGSLALNSSTSNAFSNLGVGHYSLQKITNGNDNIGLGNYTLNSLINGQDNTSIGYSALQKSTGSSNTVLGSFAGSELVTGNNNTLIGASVINSTTSGSNNTIIGKITGLGGSLSNNVIISDGSGNIRFKDDNTNTTLPRLAGTGTRMVTAGVNGELNTQAIPTGGSIAVDTIYRTLGKDSIFYKKNSITYAIKDSVGISPLDTANMLLPYLRKIDTTSLSNRINLKLNATDTASLSNRINLKLNISDTSAMLSKYLRKTDTATLSSRIDLRVKYTDTSSMLTNYARTNLVNTKLNITDTSTLQPKSIPSYTFLANNTTSIGNATTQTFKDTSGTYSGTITWTGTTAPSGATNHSYRLTQVGKCVTLHIALVYATNGSALTAVQMTLPSGAPTPVQPSGLTAASTNMYPVNSQLVNSSNNVILSSTLRGYLRNNAAGNGYEILLNFISSAPGQVGVTLQYWTN